MSYEIDVLRALLRLARSRTSPTLDQLVVRVGGDGADVLRALRALARDGLVQPTPGGLRLSMAGLAVAVACAQRTRRSARPRGASPAPPVRRRAA